MKIKVIRELIECYLEGSIPFPYLLSVLNKADNKEEIVKVGRDLGIDLSKYLSFYAYKNEIISMN